MTDDNALFTVTGDHLNTGMRGVPVGTCRTSFVTPDEGVHYCGYPIGELANLQPEDVVYLLFNKDLPTAEQASAFRLDLQQRSAIPPGVEEVFKSLPRDGHPMDWLSVGIHTLGMLDTTGDWKEDALNLIARMPRMMGLLFRYREGRGDGIPADNPSLTMVQRFVATLEMEGIDDSLMEQVLSTYLVLHMDHGGGESLDVYGQSPRFGARYGLRLVGWLNERPFRSTSRSCESILPGIRAPYRNQRPETSRGLCAQRTRGQASRVRLWSRCPAVRRPARHRTICPWRASLPRG